MTQLTRRALLAGVGGATLGLGLHTLGIARAGDAETSQPAETSLPALGPAPDFDLPVLGQDRSVRLSDLRGAPVWLSFWATWCGPCRAELAELVPFQRRWTRKGAAVWPVSLDRDPDMARAMLEREGLELATLSDAANATVGPYAAARIPLGVLIDPAGRLVRRVEGARTHLFADADGWLRELMP